MQSTPTSAVSIEVHQQLIDKERSTVRELHERVVRPAGLWHGYALRFGPVSPAQQISVLQKELEDRRQSMDFRLLRCPRGALTVPARPC
jgi:hypothetical protein